MAVVVLTSAAGSPGVTTSALGLALTWPRPVLLVEADPTGGSGILAGFFRGDVASSRGLIDLALAHRDGDLAEALASAVLPLPGTDALLLPGVRGHLQSRSLGAVWGPLGAALRGLERNGQDVIVDAGRLGLEGSPRALMAGADLTLLTMRTTLPALSAARSWAASLREDFTGRGATPRLGSLLVGEGQPYRAREVRKVLGIPSTATLPWEPDVAEVFSLGASRPRRFDSSPLVRALRAAGEAAHQVIAANRADLNATTVGSLT